mgnify:CR=1 FL=1
MSISPPALSCGRVLSKDKTMETNYIHEEVPGGVPVKIEVAPEICTPR